MTEWRPVSGTRYLVSDDGQLRHADTDQCRKLQRRGNGYVYCNFWRNRKLTLATVHSLVAEAFLGPRPLGAQVRHLDGNRGNNHISNLAYGSAKENAADRELHGNTMRGQRNGNSVISDADVDFIRLLYARGCASQDALAALFKTSQAQIHNIVHWKQRKRAA